MNIFLTTLFCFVFFFGSINNNIVPDIKITTVSKESNQYQVTLYNKSDSVLCFLSSVFAKYKKDACDTFTALNLKTTYYLSYSLTDSKIDFRVAPRHKLCILPHQELNFIVRFEELTKGSLFRMQYFYSTNYNLNDNKKETEKPGWSKKYQWSLIEAEIPF